jgi:hypothetical protein
LVEYSLRAGSEFPALQVIDGSHQVSTFSGHMQPGKHVIFYAKPTCGHCSAEMSDLEQALFVSDTKTDFHAAVLVDPDGADTEAMRGFLHQIPKGLPVFVETNGGLLHQYPATKVPSTFFMLDSGKIARVITGERTGTYLVQQIDLFIHNEKR